MALGTLDFKDTFTDSAGTSLSAHTPDTGTSWTNDSGNWSGSAFTIAAAGRIYNGQNDLSKVDAAPNPSAEHDIFWTTRSLTTSSANTTEEYAGVLARSTAGQVFYFAVRSCKTGTWQLNEIGGDGTLLSLTEAVTAGVDYQCWLRVRDRTKTLLVKGPNDFGYVKKLQNTNNAIAAAGKSGVMGYKTQGSSAGVHLDNFTIRELPYTKVNVTISSSAAVILVPTDYDPSVGANVVFYHHGLGETSESLLDDGLKADIVHGLSVAGYIVCAISTGNSWGNDASLTKYAALEAYLEANYNVLRTAILSQSMGGVSGLERAVSGSVPRLAGWLGIYPVCSLTAAYSGSFTSSINAAYGGSDASQFAGHDPLAMNAIAYAGLRMKFYASTADNSVPAANHSIPLRTAVSPYAAEYDYTACSGDHGDPSHFRTVDVLAYFQRIFAADPALAINSGRTGVANATATNAYNAANSADGKLLGNIAAQTGDAYARIGANGAGLTAVGDTRLANLDAAVSSRSSLTQQQVRDAQKLAPSAGDPDEGSVDAKLDANAVANPGTGSGQYPVDHNGGTGTAGAAVTVDGIPSATNILRMTSDGSTGLPGLYLNAYEATAYAAGTRSLVAQTRTNSTGRIDNPLMLDSGSYRLIVDLPGDGYQSLNIALVVP
jgi:hypothetical protein